MLDSSEDLEGTVYDLSFCQMLRVSHEVVDEAAVAVLAKHVAEFLGWPLMVLWV